MPRRLRVLAAAFLIALAAAPAAAQPPLYVIVPFGEPGDTDPQYANATHAFTQDLSDRQVRTTLATPTDAIDAVSNAGAMCGQYGATGLLIPQLRFEQAKERNLTGFIPVVGGVISSSGAFDASPIRARVKLYFVDCRGRVAWKTIATANKVHHGTNVAAGLTEVASQAIATAVDEFASRRQQEH